MLEGAHELALASIYLHGVKCKLTRQARHIARSRGLLDRGSRYGALRWRRLLLLAQAVSFNDECWRNNMVAWSTVGCLSHIRGCQRTRCCGVGLGGAVIEGGIKISGLFRGLGEKRRQWLLAAPRATCEVYIAVQLFKI